MAVQTLRNVFDEKEAWFLAKGMCIALHVAVHNNNAEWVEKICIIFSQVDNILLAKGPCNETVLYYAKTRVIAKKLVEAVSLEKRKGFIFSVDKFHCTALHMAASMGRKSVVKFLSSFPLKDELVLAKNNTGWTALHCSSNRKIAQSLVESVTLERQKDFVLSAAKGKVTALHLAADNGRTDVVKYLCSLSLKEELLFAKDDEGWTALHFSTNQNVSQLLVESVTSERQKEFTLSVAKNEVTALHVAAGNGRTDVVEYLCSLPVKDELLLAADMDGLTALHYSSNKKIAQSLVKTVTPERQRDFVLSAPETRVTAVHKAAGTGKIDVVEYLCNLPVKDELLLAADINSLTALHYSSSKKIAQSLVKTVRPKGQRDFVLSAPETGVTALHLAAGNGRIDVVEYLCSLPVKDELLLAADMNGLTALHYSSNKKIAQSLVETVRPERQRDFVLLVNYIQRTALHVAAEYGRADVVKYFCSLSLKEVLLLAKDDKGWTALHLSTNQKVSQLLVESVTPERQKELLLSVAKNKVTALHVAAANGRIDVVEYLCSLPVKDELLSAADMNGMTALYYSSNQRVAQLLVESVTSNRQKEFILSVAKDKITALHVAAYKERTDVVEYLCSLPVKDDLVLARGSTGETALHCSSNQRIAQLLVESVTSERQRDFILSVTDNQFTALHIAAGNGSTDVVEYLCSLPVKDELLFAKDIIGCTALHYSSNQKIAQSLVESVTAERQQDFILSGTDGQLTALHVAASNGRTDVVEYLCSLPVKDELLLVRNSTSETALHCSSNKKIAQLLVESLEPDRQRYFVYMINFFRSTALHIAAENGRTDVVEYLCRLYPNELPLKKDLLGNTALHLSKNVETARIILHSVTHEQQKHLLSLVNNVQCTALHETVAAGKTEVVKYFCKLYSNIDEVIWMKDKFGQSILHSVCDKSAAELFMRFFSKENKRKVLLSVDKYGLTPLHTATKFSRTGVVECFCSINTTGDELISTNDNGGRTVLHYAIHRKIAKLFLESVTPEKQKHFLFSLDADQCTALHLAATYPNRTEMVEYLCSLPSVDYELVCAKNSKGETALHLASNSKMVKAILNHVDSEKLPSLLESEDNTGNTPVLLLTHLGNSDALRQLLEHIEIQCKSEIMSSCLQKRNKLKQNILHLAASSLSFERLYDVLVEYIHNVDVTNMMYPDVNGNTPIHYVADRYGTRVFADFMLRLPLPMRQYIVNYANGNKKTCLDIISKPFSDANIFFDKCGRLDMKVPCEKIPWLEKIFRPLKKHAIDPFGSVGPISHINYDENIHKVLNHALNYYSLPYHISLKALPALDTESENRLQKKSKVSQVIVFYCFST